MKLSTYKLAPGKTMLVAALATVMGLGAETAHSIAAVGLHLEDFDNDGLQSDFAGKTRQNPGQRGMALT